MINDPIFDEETRAILDKMTMESFRDYVARILRRSPFDFRSRRLTKAEAERIADELIDKIKTIPDRGAAFMKAVYMGDDLDG